MPPLEVPEVRLHGPQARQVRRADEVAEVLRQSPATVHALCRSGAVPAARLSRELRPRRDSGAALFARGRGTVRL